MQFNPHASSEAMFFLSQGVCLGKEVFKPVTAILFLISLEALQKLAEQEMRLCESGATQRGWGGSPLRR